jgi:transmembrane sensor
MKISDNILLLIIKHLSKQGSEEDEKTLAAWLEQSEENRAEFEKTKRVWNGSQSPLDFKVDVNAQWNKFKANTFEKDTNKNHVRQLEPTSKRSNWFQYAAAAVVLIGMFLSGVWFLSADTYATQDNERLFVSLPDGTEITLAANSNLTVPHTFNWMNRNLKLDGEGFFKIAKNPDKVFTIAGTKTTTQILGTAFRLKATDKENSIDVAEGKVAYWSNAQNDTLILTHGETGRLNQGVLEEKTTAKALESAWFTGIFKFNQAPLPSVLSELQNHYGFSLDVKGNESLPSCAFSGTFDKQEKNEVIEELSLSMNFSYTWENNTLIIEKIQCN